MGQATSFANDEAVVKEFMGQALYRKYRSQNLEEIVGQQHVVSALKNALRNDKISHAYLLSGPRGVGKTSVARILAAMVNGLPYDQISSHLDIIEIDAASNRRIDEIRDLREKVHITPTSAKYKVYIIDEVHMLTREAFNALLKTLEEPPAHVIFILATTEAQKLPETIVSRTQRFTFKPITSDDLFEQLAVISKKEQIAISDEALRTIAQHGAGSFRDALNLLDQVRNVSDKIEIEDIVGLLGLVPEATTNKIADYILSGDAKAVVNILSKLRDQGISPAIIAKQVGQNMRQELLDNNLGTQEASILLLLEKLLGVASAAQPYLYLELVLLETALGHPKTVDGVKKPHSKPLKVDGSPSAPKIATVKKPLIQDNSELWQALLSAVKQQHNTLYSVLRMATPEFTDNELLLHFGFGFHKKRVDDAKNREVISSILKDLNGNIYSVRCELSVPEKSKPALIKKKMVEDDALNNISNIFGGAEMLDS